MNQKYFLKDGAVAHRDATPEELKTSRGAALDKMKTDPPGWAMRTCWNCNPAHKHFLNDLEDGFLFSCVAGCGRWFYQGVDVTEDGFDR